MSECDSCRSVTPADAGICESCGRPLAITGPTRGGRVTTVLFSDVTGFTTIAERLDPEALSGVMEDCFITMRAVVVRHGGRVEKFLGDAVLAHDRPGRQLACRAASAMCSIAGVPRSGQTIRLLAMP